MFSDSLGDFFCVHFVLLKLLQKFLLLHKCVLNYFLVDMLQWAGTDWGVHLWKPLVKFSWGRILICCPLSFTLLLGDYHWVLVKITIYLFDFILLWVSVFTTHFKVKYYVFAQCSKVMGIPIVKL